MKNNSAFFEPLEPRVLLSGSPVPETNDSPAVNAEAPTAESSNEQEIFSELVFIDTAVKDYQNVLDQLERNVEVILIGTDENGLNKISETLADRQNISAIHIISHGDSGKISLGNMQLTAENIGDYHGQLNQWASALTEHADLLIYGCNVGQDITFINSLASMTTTDVAASDDLSGHERFGADADLEVTTGSIGHPSLEIQHLDSILANPDAVNDDYQYLGDLQVDASDGLLTNDTDPIDPLHATDYAFGESEANGADWSNSDLSWTMRNFGSNTSYTENPETSFKGITSAYTFDGTANTGATANSFETLGANPTQESASFEIWFQTNDLSQNAILFETGATTDGISLYLEGGDLVLHTRDNNIANTEVRKTLDATTDFIQAVIVLDYVTHNLQLYVDGILAGDTSLGGLDWAGGNGSALGTDANAPAAGTGDFTGQIALFNFYEEALSSANILGNYTAVTATAATITAVNGDNTLVGKQFTTASGGLLTVNSDGSFDYSPVAGFSGEETFTYTITNSDNNTDTATVSLTSAIVDDSYSVLGDLQKNSSEGLLSNDTVGGADGIISTDYNLAEAQATGATWSNNDLTWTMKSFGTNTNFTTTPGSNYDGITSAYTFDGDANTGALAPSFQNLAGDPTNGSASIELWFQTDNLNQNAILFETGGTGHGTSIYLENGKLVLHSRYGGTPSTELKQTLAATNEFIQVVAVLDYAAATNGLQLYIDGALVGQTDLVGSDWDGGNNAALGTDSNAPAAGTGDFTGQIALFNFYGDALTASEVTGNFDAITSTPATITAINNDINLVGQPVATASGGQVTVNSDGSFNYSPVAGFTGEETFTYTVTDEDGNQATATVTLKAAAADDGYTINENSTLDVTASGVLDNDTEVNNSELFIKSVDTSSTLGTVTMASVDLEMGEAGTVDVDSAGTTINFQGTYATPPLVFAFITTTNESDATVVRVSNVTTTEFNIALDEVGNGTHGNETVTYIVLQEGQWLLPDGSLLEVGTFTTTEHSDSFETIGLNSAFTDAPAVFSQVQTNESTIDLLKTRHDNATKSEIKITLEGADNANMAGSENETIAYFAIERGSGAWGHINFEAGSTSDSVSHNTSEVSLNTITPEHFIAAMANFDGADNASTRGEGIVDGKLNLFVEEDTTVDAEIAHTSEVVDYLAFSGTGLLLATPQAGLADTGGFSYDPGTLFDHLAVGDTATDTFTYTVTDLTGQESTATVTITIHGENDAPTSSDNAFTIDEDNTYNFKIADFAFTDIDDGDSLKAIQIDSLPAVGNGVLLLNGNPVADGDFITAAQISQLSFTPDSNDFGVAYASFNFSVQDQQNALSSSHSLTINVNEVNDQAIFSGNLDGVDVENGADISGSLIASDINDGLSDPNFTILGGSPNGTATIDANGNWNFTPNANFSGLTSFTVQITDDNGNNETVLVIITVTPAPIINPSDTERPTTAPQVNDQAAIILASVNQEILRGNAFLFLSDGGGLHFNERFLSEDSLNLISDYFNSSTFEDTEVAANDDEIEVKTLNIYDVSALPTEEQEFIKNLILQEINEATEEKEEKEDSDDLSFLSDEMALQEIVNQSTEEIPFSQFDLDKRVNLEDTLMNEFDCLTINHLKHS